MADLKNDFSWSKSRDGTFRECLRAYYYTHYGSWGGWERRAPADVRELYLMKNLNTRATWVGIVVHEVAEWAVQAIRAGARIGEQEALEEATGRMRKELELSQDEGYRRTEKIRWRGKLIKAAGLQEHYYGTGASDELFESSIELARQCIGQLFRTPTYHRLLEVGGEAIVGCEELESVLVGDVKVWVKLDLAVRGREGRIVIVDWKTGGSHRQDDISLQLGIYGLYGTRKWKCSAEDLLGYDVNLRDGATHSHPINEERMVEVDRYIRESAGEMRALLDDVPGNIASIDRFPMTTEESRCGQCRYRRACKRE